MIKVEVGKYYRYKCPEEGTFIIEALTPNDFKLIEGPANSTLVFIFNEHLEPYVTFGEELELL